MKNSAAPTEVNAGNPKLPQISGSQLRRRHKSHARSTERWQHNEHPFLTQTPTYRVINKSSAGSSTALVHIQPIYTSYTDPPTEDPTKPSKHANKTEPPKDPKTRTETHLTLPIRFRNLDASSSELQEKGGRKEHKTNEQKFQKTHLYGCMQRGEGYASQLLSEGNVTRTKGSTGTEEKTTMGSDDGKGSDEGHGDVQAPGGRVKG
ncbi:hypothetical protein BJ322DRAFT_1020648 [Thelephora terrestris]|uniref:Uncharacterized protein n=1 Tax=Thelephora terrestris TaxID=56493 RepID=A0A9P6HDJ4_9AGAM|nr:hypothetical protein BJ322DRAFT_1020648 [Thelephora terrestris]